MTNENWNNLAVETKLDEMIKIIQSYESYNKYPNQTAAEKALHDEVYSWFRRLKINPDLPTTWSLMGYNHVGWNACAIVNRIQFLAATCLNCKGWQIILDDYKDKPQRLLIDKTFFTKNIDRALSFLDALYLEKKLL
jgi:hypothetical protein